MAEKFKENRIKFLKGKQRAFVEAIEKEFSINEMAKWCGRSERTIRDWRREKFLIDEKSLKILCDKADIEIPKNIETVDKYWYTHKGAKKGWDAVIDKYGEMPKNEEYRKEKWYEWWEKEGRFKTDGLTRAPMKIKKPKHSSRLAEFVGIILGDGGISHQQVIVTLHSKDDKAYGDYVKKLMEDLFGAHVGIHKRRDANACSYMISRVELVKFCENELGLVQGSKIKNQVDVPEWIKKSRRYSVACARGLMDTDGSIFTHEYSAKGKEYKYKKASFNNSSKPLIIFISNLWDDMGIKNRIARKGKEVRIDSKEDMKKYFKLIGTNNPKHLKRYVN